MRQTSAVIVVALVILLLSPDGCLADSPSETEAFRAWKTGDRLAAIQTGAISQSIRNSWWALATEMIRFAQDEGVDVISEVQQSIAAVQREITVLMQVLEHQAAQDQIQTFSPAFQWAESNEKIFLNIKLAYRWTSPGALVVEGQNVTILSNRILFSGIGTHSNIAKHYKLDLLLKSDIIPEESDYSWGAVGKMLMTLKKLNPGRWESLQSDAEKKISNAGIWWEMKEQIEVNEKRETEERKKAREAEDRKKAREAEKAAPGLTGRTTEAATNDTTTEEQQQSTPNSMDDRKTEL